MGILIPILSIPLAILSVLIFNLYGNWAHTKLEQTRLEAVTYSICHHRRHYIESDILALNAEIRWIARAMDVQAAACMGVGDVLLPEFCTSVHTFLRGQAAMAKALMLTQDAARIAGYRISAVKFRKKILAANELTNEKTEGHFSLWPSSIASLWSDGLKRAELNRAEKVFAKYYGIPNWPQTLDYDEGKFSRSNTFKTQFAPVRGMVAVTSRDLHATQISSDKDFGSSGMKVQQFKTADPWFGKSISLSQTGCYLKLGDEIDATTGLKKIAVEVIER